MRSSGQFKPFFLTKRFHTHKKAQISIKSIKRLQANKNKKGSVLMSLENI